MVALHLLRGLHNPGLGEKGVANTKCVATIGNFDGVHVGHQAIIRQVISEAKRRCLPALIVIFEPQPLEFFKGIEAPARLMRFREKFQVLAEFDLDFVFCLKFDESLSRLSAREFVQNVLVNHLNVEHLVIGDDFRFGGDRQGDYRLLQTLSRELGFTVENTPTILASPARAQEQRASSTYVRELLAQGELAKVELLLGRLYSISGRIVHGQKLGRELGFPTANIDLKRSASPLCGVYAVSLQLKNSATKLPGVANVGSKPSVGQFKPLLEVHLLDFNEQIYGAHATVIFHKKLRDEQKFADLSLLKAQIATDISGARSFFEHEFSARTN